MCAPIGAVTQLPVLLVSKSNPFIIVAVFKTMLPSFVGNCYIFCFSKSIGKWFGLINETVEGGKAKK